MGERKKSLKQYSLCVLSGLVLIAVIVAIFVYILPMRRNAAAFGEEIGKSAGTLTGYAVGSFKGLTEGREAGYKAGREEGLKAEDLDIEVAEALESAGALEVLVASVQIVDTHEVGKDYAAIYAIFGDAVFTVDLTQASITIGTGNEVLIDIPQPKAALYINDSKTEKIAEYKKSAHQGSTEAGYQAYINSMNEITENAAEHIAGYDSLMEQAKAAAKNQVELFAKNVCGAEKTITVSFM